jgi:transposase
MAKIQFIPVPSKQTLLFPSRLDEDIASDAPVRVIDQVLDKINIDGILKLYHVHGRNAFQPRMMLKIIICLYEQRAFLSSDRGTPQA